jgi:hypothetical protein
MGRTRNNIYFGTPPGSLGQTMPYVFSLFHLLTITAAGAESAALPQSRRECDKAKTPEWNRPK